VLLRIITENPRTSLVPILKSFTLFMRKTPSIQKEDPDKHQGILSDIFH
jgi:hypothetical protein